jgi:hypothetical protein
MFIDMHTSKDYTELPPICFGEPMGVPQPFDWEEVVKTCITFNKNLPFPIALPVIRIAMDGTRTNSDYYVLKHIERAMGVERSAGATDAISASEKSALSPDQPPASNETSNSALSFDLDVDEEGLITLNSGKFDASGFSTGYALFHAFRTLCMDEQGMATSQFETFISNVHSSLQILDAQVVADFHRSHELWNEALVNRKTIYEWDPPGVSMYTWWVDAIEVLRTGSKTFLLYTLSKGDFALDGMGWDCADDNVSVITRPFFSVDDYLAKYDTVDWAYLTSHMTYDGLGKAVMLMDEVPDGGPFNRLPDLLLKADNILNEDIHKDMMAALNEEFGDAPNT